MIRRTRVAFASVGLMLPVCTPRVETLNGSPPALASPAVSLAEPPQTLAASPVTPSGPLHFLAIGGGATPESTEVSLEQDIELVQRALPPAGLVLFAGGSGSESVRELDPVPKGDPVLLALGELFSPRNGRGSRYRAPRFSAERATLENVEARLSFSFAHGETPLVVYIAAHGDQGPDAKGNSVALWGGRSLTVTRLAELHEQHQRTLRLVATSCFSGGFAELAFAHADEKAGPAQVPRCGLFAGTFDRETSGCDPNPDRRAQESYGLHFAHALAGTRKDGSPLPLASADYDHDGKIGLLDAHTWARIQAVSFDVPTTTSERWLRHAETRSAPIDAALLPEDAAVVEQLGQVLSLTDEASVRKRWVDLDRRISELSDRMQEADDELAARDADESTSLLERWPVLDDPFHPDFALTFERNRAAVAVALNHSAPASARAEAQQRVQTLAAELGQVGVEEARVLRLLRAYETLHKASALLKRGGAAAKFYASLLACERGAP